MNQTLAPLVDRRAFEEDGYVVLDVDLDPDLCERAIDLVWEHCPESFDRNRPETWTGVVKDCCHTQTIDERKGRVKFRQCVRQHDWIRDLCVDHPEIRAAVECLIGEPVRNKFYRGLYPVFPLPESVGAPGGHCDRHPFQVGAVIYIDEVEPGGGGFVVWPGSHKILIEEARDLGVGVTPPEYDAARKSIIASGQPKEITGKRGTVILWHQKLLHAPSANRGTKVRHAILCDFMNAEYSATEYQAYVESRKNACTLPGA